MAEFFTLRELTKSSTGETAGIVNTPGPKEIEALNALMRKVLDPIRRMWGKPVYVNSGFRSEALNKLVGGAETSQHRLGEAADITTGTRSENKELFQMIVQSAIPFDQLIDEKNYSWIHVSYGPRNRRQILHL